MTKSQENKSTRNHYVLGVSTEFGPIWENHVEFKGGIEKFITASAAIDAQAAIQRQNITGIALDKDVKKEQLAKLTVNVSGQQAYASTIKNNDLFNSMNYSVAKLMHGRDTNIAGTADFVAGKATELAVVLLPFGITAAVVSSLSALSEDYRKNFLSAPETAINKRKNITEDALPKLFTEADSILKNQLLKLVVQFNSVSPEFVQQFIYATFIGTAGVRHTRLSAVVNSVMPSDIGEAVTKPLENALVVIEDTGLSGNTDEKGKLTLTKVPEKAKKVTVTYNNITIVKTVKFERGKATKLTVDFESEFSVPPNAPVVNREMVRVNK